MHACGHDCHVAILMGVAEILAGLRAQLHGSVKFIFQPAEEMPPDGEEGGAKLMIEQGVLREPGAARRSSACTSRRGCRSASSATGRARRWRARTASDHRPRQADARRRAVARRRPDRDRGPGRLGLQTIVSRGVDITREPAVVTVGMIKGGVRENIIPDSVEMRGTVRTFDEEMRDDIHERVTTLAEAIARGSRAGCKVCIEKNYPVTVNDPALTEAMVPTLQRVAGPDRLLLRAEGDRRRGLLVLPAGRAGPVLLRRRDAAGHRSGQGVLEPLAALLRRRTRPGRRRARAGAADLRLFRAEGLSAGDEWPAPPTHGGPLERRRRRGRPILN